MLCAFSLFVAAVTASEAAARDGLLAVLDRSRARCVHGDAGVVISVHSAVSPSTYRANLEKAFPHQHHRDANRFHREYTHINAIVMTAIHPETLAHVAKHEHTTDLEASCIIQHTLPTPVNESEWAKKHADRKRGARDPQNLWGSVGLCGVLRDSVGALRAGARDAGPVFSLTGLGN